MKITKKQIDIEIRHASLRELVRAVEILLDEICRRNLHKLIEKFTAESGKYEISFFDEKGGKK